MAQRKPRLESREMPMTVFRKGPLLLASLIGLSVMSAVRIHADAKAAYEKQCTKCHGADGKGLTKMGRQSGAKDYTDPKVQEGVTDEAAFKAIKEGLKVKGKEVMKPSEGLSDAEIKEVIAYMRAFKK